MSKCVCVRYYAYSVLDPDSPINPLFALVLSGNRGDISKIWDLFNLFFPVSRANFHVLGGIAYVTMETGQLAHPLYSKTHSVFVLAGK